MERGPLELNREEACLRTQHHREKDVKSQGCEGKHASARGKLSHSVETRTEKSGKEAKKTETLATRE